MINQNKPAMKKFCINILIIFLLSANNLFAQEVIKKNPVKKPDLGVKEMMIDGMKVIYKQSTKDIISASLFVKGGTANYSKDQEGIENLAMSVLAESGSQKYPHETYNSLLESYGTVISSQSGEDESQVSMTCLKKSWNESWDIFADLIMHPLFDENTFNNKKEEALNNIKQIESNPDLYLENLIYKNIFNGTNYNKKVEGTEASINSITQNVLKKYYSDLMRKNKLFVVIVGNVSENDLKAKISGLKGIPAGTAPTTLADKRPDFRNPAFTKKNASLQRIISRE